MDIFKAKNKAKDRYDGLYQTAKGFRCLSFILSGAVIVLVLGLLFVSTRRQIVPWVVQVDKQGYEVAVGPATPVSQLDSRIVISHVGRFIENLRSVVSDPNAQKVLVENVYASIPDSTAAFPTTNKFYQDNDPFRGAKNANDTISVEVRSILPISERTWRGEWIETHSRAGIIQKAERWTGLFTVAASPTKDMKDVIRNPLGIYITEYSVSPVNYN